MRSHKFLLFALVLALLAAAVPACLGAGVKYVSKGTYIESGKTQHAWSINDGHTLLWDGEPFIPVGGVFASRYLSLGATDENYQADVSALTAIKAKGIADIILKSTKPITETDPAAWQKVIDYLDGQSFTYGIEIDDGPKAPLSGSIVAPGIYRLEGPSAESTITCTWPGVDAALYVVARSYDNTIRSTGGAIVKDGKVTMNLPEPLSVGDVMVVYPRKTFKAVSEGGMGDPWTGFGEYRDRLLAFMKGVKLGRGLRFFVEPLTSKIDFTGDMAGFVPDSSGFRLGMEAYLQQKYVHEGSLNAAWGLLDTLDKVETAARLLPLWWQGRGLAYAYDRASANMFPVDSAATQTWRDITEYRDRSAREFMNTIADTLKKNVADVPVIYKCARHHAIYYNPFGMGGFDGLGAVAYGTGETPVVTAAGPAYSLAEESAKTTWFVVAGTASTSGQKSLVGYSNEAAMAATMDSFREIGCKGFYVDSLQALPDETRGNFSLLKASEQLDWLKGVKDKLAKATNADFKPDVVYFPAAISTGAYVKRLARNSWWLPTLRTGKSTYIGDGMTAYALTGEDRTVMWSSSGERQITLQASNSLFPSIESPQGAGISKRKNGQFAVKLNETPIALRGMNLELAFPYETAQAEIDKLSKLIPIADKQGLDVKAARDAIDQAKLPLKNGVPMTAYGIVQSELQKLLAQTGSDLWLEAEECASRNLGAPAAAPGASGGIALILDTDEDSPLAPYAATFKVNADANTSYEIWVAGTPPGEGSPVSYTIDETGGGPLAAEGKAVAYGPGLAWYKIGTANLFPGNHTLKFKVDGRRSQDNRYYFVLDTVVLSPRGFTPDGVNKPF